MSIPHGSALQSSALQSSALQSSTLHGMDIAQAPRLIESLRLWSAKSEDVLATLHMAETLSDLQVGVDNDVNQLGTDGSQLSLAVNRAFTTLTNHQLVLTRFDAGALARALAALRMQDLDGGGRLLGAGLKSGSEPLSDGQVGRLDQMADVLAELAAEIAGRDAAGQRSQKQRKALHELLRQALGTSGNASAAFSMLLNGLPASELSGVLALGVSAALAKIAHAMELGLTPNEAGLSASLFPVAYADWHRVQERIDGIDLQLEALAHAQADEQVHQLQQARLDLVMQRGAMVVGTLDQPASSDTDGALRTFDAIGAAAATLTEVPGDFVGESYAALWFDFSEAELPRMAELLASHAPSALAFAVAMGPAQMATLLDDISLATSFGATSPDMNKLIENLGDSLALASHHLPREFAAEMISSRPMSLAAFGVHLPPELLFSDLHAEQFLIEAAATSLRVNGVHLATSHGDARVGILQSVASAGLGADLTVRLDEQGDLDRLLFADPPLSAEATWQSTINDSGTPPSSLFAVIVGQAAGSPTASGAIIRSAASSKNQLDRAQAQALSALLARQVPNYLETPATSSYFELAHRVFVAGEGRELDAAVRLQLVREAQAGFESGEEYWWDDVHAATFAGNIDLQKYLALQGQTIELATDELNPSSNLGDLLTGLSVAHGAAPLFVEAHPTIATVYTVTGIAISAAPWLLPISAVPQVIHDFYDAQLLQSYSTVDRGQAIVLLAALRSGALQPAWNGAVWLDETAVGPHVVVATPEGGITSVDVMQLGDGWVDAVGEALPPDTEIRLDANTSARLEDALDLVGTAIFSDDYSTAMQEGLERQSDG